MTGRWMNGSGEFVPAPARARERGGARLNFLLVMAGIAALVYVGAQYVPAAYRAWGFKRFMKDTVDQAATMNKPPEWVERRLRENFDEYVVPEDATVRVARDGKHMAASVRYTHPISLLVTEYEYDFDVNARSVAFVGGP